MEKSAKTLANKIIEVLRYQPVGYDWARLNQMMKRYGYENVNNAITNMGHWNFKINNVMNYLEKQCQKEILKGKKDESFIKNVIKGL